MKIDKHGAHVMHLDVYFSDGIINCFSIEMILYDFEIFINIIKALLIHRFIEIPFRYIKSISLFGFH